MSTLDDEDVDAIARRVVELLRPALTPTGASPGRHEPPEHDGSSLAKWLRTEHPDAADALTEPIETWADTLTAAANETDPIAALDWAWSQTCPTAHWRSQHRPIAAPARRNSTRRTDGGFRYGPWLQLLAEYRLAASDSAAALHDVDALVDTLINDVARLGTKPAAATVSSRKNALAILTSTPDAPATVRDIVTWCLTTKTHWRSNLTGVPKLPTYRSMRGDWTAAGNGFSVDTVTDPTLRQQIVDLGTGWSWYLAQILGHQIDPSSRTHQRVHDLLTGTDGHPPVECPDLQATVRWLCDPTAGRLRYYSDGMDFPRPDRARKALLDMRSGPRDAGGVAETNTAAADSAGNHADDDLKGML